MKNLKNKKGFTLVELIVVIAILGILALFLVPSFKGYSEDAKKQVAQSNVRTVWEAAKAAETSAEYKKDSTADTIVADAKEKLGKSFTIDKTNFTFNDKDELVIDKVNYTTNGVDCTYDGKDFGGTCNPKKTTE